MKKVLLAALMALVAVPSFAAPDDDALFTSSNGVVQFDMASHIGYGYHFVKSADFKPNWSGEIFFNVLKIGIYPAEVLGIEMNVDCLFNNFNSKTAVFSLDKDKLVHATDFSEVVPSGYEKSRGGLNVFSLSTPVLLKGIFGDFEVGVGAEASFNLVGDVYHRYRKDNVRTRIDESKAKVNPFSYGFVATFSHNDAGIFFKYYPKSSRLLPEGSVDLSYMTLGIAFGF
jgi:hypothetical protein